MVDDAELVLSSRGGDRAAFGELCRRYWPLVGRYFVSKVDTGADDMRQETFGRLLTALDRFEGRSSARGFILGIAHNVLLEHLRGKYQSNDRETDLDELSMVEFGASPTALIARREEQRALLHALRRVPLTFQVVLELTYWEGLSDTEIGDVLAIPANTVRSRRVRARERLQRELQPRADDEASIPVLTETPENFEAWARRIGRELGASEDDRV